MCSNPQINLTLELSEKCSHEGRHGKYSAPDSLLDSVRVPFQNVRGFYSSAPASNLCKTELTLISTVIATSPLFSSYDFVLCIFSDNDQSSFESSVIQSLMHKGMAMCVKVPLHHKDTSECEVTAGHDVSYKCSMENVMAVILSLQRACKSLVWYWDKDLVGYSYLFGAAGTVHWICTLQEGEYTSSNATARTHLSDRKSVV